MPDTVRERLIKAAQLGRPITYADLVTTCQLRLNLSLDHDRAELGRILGDISRAEYEQGRPLLSVVAVLAGTTLPSEGFYRLAETLGLGTAKRLRQNLFGEQEMKKCFDFWGKPRNDAAE